MLTQGKISEKIKLICEVSISPSLCVPLLALYVQFQLIFTVPSLYITTCFGLIGHYQVYTVSGCRTPLLCVTLLCSLFINASECSRLCEIIMRLLCTCVLYFVVCWFILCSVCGCSECFCRSGSN
jgi:hypothetical protein